MYLQIFNQKLKLIWNILMDGSDLESNLSIESAEKGIILEGIVEIYL